MIIKNRTLQWRPVVRGLETMRGFVVSGMTMILLLLFILMGSISVRAAESLRDAAASTRFPLRVGAAVRNNYVNDASRVNYNSLLRYNYQLASPENAMKWASFRPSLYSYTWTTADDIVRFARSNGDQVRGHTLVWHSSAPSWIPAANYSPDELRDVLFHHIDTVVGRYRGDAYCWDVVNEAFTSEGTLRTSMWYDAPGIGYAANGTRYIEEAFRRAHLADPSTKLIYNDWSMSTINTKSNAVYAMAQDFVARGVPLHGMGFQMHIGPAGKNYDSMRSNFQRFSNLGLDLHISEMDVYVPQDINGEVTPEDLENQAEVYWNVLAVALGNPRVKVFQTWGFTDAHAVQPKSLPYDNNFLPKPAYWAIWNALANQAETLPVHEVSTGTATDMVTHGSFSAGAGRQLSATAVQDFISFTAKVPYPGQWNIRIGVRKQSDGGNFQLAVAPESGGAFVQVGTPQDTFASSVSYSVLNLGDFTATVAGDHHFRFAVTGKNISSSGYKLVFDYLRFTPTNPSPGALPTVSALVTQVTQEDTPVGPIAFTVGDTDTPVEALMVSARSFNTNLLPSENIVFGGSGANRTLTLTPAENKSGTAGVIVKVSDGVHDTLATFVLKVTPVNSAPVASNTYLSVQNDSSINVDLGGLVTDDKSLPNEFVFTAKNAEHGTVELLPDGRTARFTPANGYIGEAAFTYSATDANGPDPRLALHYPFGLSDTADDKHATDLSNSDMPATIEEFGTGTGTYEDDAPPLLGQDGPKSLRLTGQEAGRGARMAVRVPASVCDLRNSDWTLVTWFKREAHTHESWLMHIGSGDGAGGDGESLELRWTTAGEIELCHYNTSNALDVQILAGPCVTDEWHHAAIVFDRTSTNTGVLRLYVNGVLADESTEITWALNQANDLILGGVKNGAEERWLNGALGDVALYKTTLTTNEIMSLADGWPVANLGGLQDTNSIFLTVEPPLQTNQIYMIQHDGAGQSSFGSGTNWDGGAAPTAGNDYFSAGFNIRTLDTITSETFAGDSLTFNGGSFLYKGPAVGNNAKTSTINSLILNGALLQIVQPGTQTWTIAGNMRVDGESYLSPFDTYSKTDVGTIILQSNITGTAPLVVRGDGVGNVTISGNNSGFSGGWLVGKGRTETQMTGTIMKVNHANALGAGAITMTYGIVDLNGFNSTIGGLSGVNTTTNIIKNDGASASILTVGNASNLSKSYAGVIQDGISSISLTKAGEGTLTLSGANTYTGPTNVEVGTLIIDGSNTTTAGNLTVAAGARLGGMGSTPAALTMQANSKLLSVISNWTGSPGDGFTTLSVGSLVLDGAWTLDVASLTDFANFSEANISFPIITAADGITGFNAGNVTVVVDDSFIGAGEWSIVKNLNTLELVYTASIVPINDYAAWDADFPGNDLSDKNADNDGDGLSNFYEYAFGLDPTSSASVSPICEISNLKNLGQFTYTRRVGSGLVYKVWTSTNLQTWDLSEGVAQDFIEREGNVETIMVKFSPVPTSSDFFSRVSAE